MYYIYIIDYRVYYIEDPDLSGTSYFEMSFITILEDFC